MGDRAYHNDRSAVTDGGNTSGTFADDHDHHPQSETPSDRFPTQTDGNSDELSRDTVFHILQTRRRRDVLRYLSENGGPVSLRDLAEYVAANEQDTTVQGLTSTERQRVYISLYQSHLPKLDEHGIVEYDKDRGIVDVTARIATFEPYLATTASSNIAADDRWPHLYAAIAIAGIALVVSSLSSITPFSSFTATIVVISAFVLTTGVHIYFQGLNASD